VVKIGDGIVHTVDKVGEMFVAVRDTEVTVSQDGKQFDFTKSVATIASNPGPDEAKVSFMLLDNVIKSWRVHYSGTSYWKYGNFVINYATVPTQDLLGDSVVIPNPENKYPLFTQTVSSFPSVEETATWASDIYGNGLARCGRDVAACGCAITSLVMAGRYAGVTEDILGGDVNPGNINDYLKNTKGYFSNGAVKWLAAQAYLGTFTGETIASRFSAPEFVYKMGEIDTALTDGRKAVLGDNGSHFIWLTEKTVDGYLLNDPVWYNTKTADDVVDEDSVLVKDYDDTFLSARVFTIYDEPVALSEYGIEAQITGTAELLYRSVAGERVGYVDGVVVIDLEHSSYGDAENISLTGELSAGGKHLLVPDADATFTLEVIGTGVGEYSLEFYALAADGTVTTFDLSGRTIPGVTTTFTFNLVTGEVKEEPISYQQFLDILNRELEGYTVQQRTFFLRWAERIYSNLEKKTVSQTLQSLEAFGKLLVAKKVESPVLSSAVVLLKEVVRGGRKHGEE